MGWVLVNKNNVGFSILTRYRSPDTRVRKRKLNAVFLTLQERIVTAYDNKLQTDPYHHFFML